MPSRKTQSYRLVRLLVVVTMIVATVTAPVLPVVSTSSTVSMAALLDGDKATPAEHGQQERNDDQSHAFLHSSILSSSLRAVAVVRRTLFDG